MANSNLIRMALLVLVLVLGKQAGFDRSLIHQDGDADLSDAARPGP